MRSAAAASMTASLQDQQAALERELGQIRGDQAAADAAADKAQAFGDYVATQTQRFRDWLTEQHYRLKIAALERIQAQYAEAMLRKHAMDEPTIKRLTGGMREVYTSTPLLPMNALNRQFPIRKRINDESGWDRFQNTMAKGWHKFVKWFCSVGWKILLQISVDVLLGCIPGVGTLLGMVARTGADVMLDILDHCKTSAERAHLQRAIEEGKSRGLDEWDEMFMWRSIMVVLILGVAQREGWILNGWQLGDVFRTRPEFMDRIQNQEFLKGLWAVEAMATQELFGIDPNDDEVPFEKVPQDVADARQLCYDMLDECLRDGTVRGYSVRDISYWLQ